MSRTRVDGGIGQVDTLMHGATEIGVPAVGAAGPGQFGGEGGEKIVKGPGNDRVVVHAHVQVDETDCVSDPFFIQSLIGGLIG